MHVEVIVPDDYMGDVMGDMNKRRGRIIGMEQCEGGQKIIAEAPLSEMFKYATDLRSMTQAWGRFTMTFERYEEVPAPTRLWTTTNKPIPPRGSAVRRVSFCTLHSLFCARRRATCNDKNQAIYKRKIPHSHSYKKVPTCFSNTIQLQ